jgi:hypothetical protein
MGLFIICGCLTKLHPLLTKLFPNTERFRSQTELSVPGLKPTASISGGKDSPNRKSSEMMGV